VEERERKLGKKNIREYLVMWKNILEEDGTWEGQQVL